MNSFSLSRARRLLLVAAAAVVAAPAAAAVATGGATGALLAVPPALVAVILLLVVANGLAGASRDMSAAAATMGAVAAGDTNLRLDVMKPAADLVPLFDRVNDVLDRVEAFQREAHASMAVLSQRRYYRRIVETGLTGTFLEIGRAHV